MITKNTPAKLVGVGIGGKGNPVASFSFAIAYYLSEQGDGGFADLLFKAAPDMLAAMESRPGAGVSKTKHSLPGEKIFDGLLAHRFRMWGLPAASRQPGAEPIIDTKAANIKGEAKLEFDYGDGVGNTAGKITFSVKVPTGQLGALSIRDIGQNLHGECWLDLEELQTDVEPDRRKPAKAAKQQTIDDVVDAEDEPGDVVSADPAFDLQPGDESVILIAVPEHFLGVARVIEAIGIDADHARTICRRVTSGTPHRVVSGITVKTSEAIVEALEAAGAAARHEHVEPDAGQAIEDPVGERMAEELRSTELSGDAQITGVEVTSESESAAVEMARELAKAKDWQPLEREQIEAFTDPVLAAYLSELDLSQLRTQHRRTVGKRTKSSSKAFIIERILEELARKSA